MIRRIMQKMGLSGSDKKKKADPQPEPKKKKPAAQAPTDGGRKRSRGGRTSRSGKQEEWSPKQRASAPPKKKWTPDQFKVAEKEGEIRFHDFDLPDPIMHAIQDLGFEYCTPIQAKVLAHGTSRADIAGRAQTGTGKTAAFLINILSEYLTEERHREQRKPGTPRALVLAPTRELVVQLVKDAADLSTYCNLRCMAVYGGMDFEKQKQELLKHPVDLVAATPGRLLDFMRRNVLDLKQLDTLVIDEADRMLDMGFIPDVNRIVRATPPKNKRRTMLFSATLTDHVLNLAGKWMTDPIFCEVDPEQVTVDTVDQQVFIATEREKFPLLCNMLEQKPDMKRVLVFGNRRDSTQRLADRLRKQGYRCAYLSGAVPQNKRLQILEDFREGRVRILVATDVAGRGLHIEDITHVVNYEFPYEAEDYVHRIGRTGRAGVKGIAISFACENESFVIPDIEKYIGRELPCTMPDPDLLKPVHRPSGQK